MRKRRTIENDMIDEIAWRIYGSSSLYVEALLDQNYRLSDYDELLPADVEIELPELLFSEPVARLWDEK